MTIEEKLAGIFRYS